VERVEGEEGQEGRERGKEDEREERGGVQPHAVRSSVGVPEAEGGQFL